MRSLVVSIAASALFSVGLGACSQATEVASEPTAAPVSVRQSVQHTEGPVGPGDLYIGMTLSDFGAKYPDVTLPVFCPNITRDVVEQRGVNPGTSRLSIDIREGRKHISPLEFEKVAQDLRYTRYHYTDGTGAIFSITKSSDPHAVTLWDPNCMTTGTPPLPLAASALDGMEGEDARRFAAFNEGSATALTSGGGNLITLSVPIQIGGAKYDASIGFRDLRAGSIDVKLGPYEKQKWSATLASMAERYHLVEPTQFEFDDYNFNRRACIGYADAVAGVLLYIDREAIAVAYREPGGLGADDRLSQCLPTEISGQPTKGQL